MRILRSMLIASASVAVLAATPVNAQDCREALEQLRQNMQGANLGEEQQRNLTRQMEEADRLIAAERNEDCFVLVTRMQDQMDGTQTQAGQQQRDQQRGEARQQTPRPKEQGAQARQQAGGQQGQMAEIEVSQPAAQIIVRQPQPEITIRQPRAQIEVRIPDPEVEIRQADAEVAVQQPEPNVQIERSEPRITYEAEDPEVRVQHAEAGQRQDGDTQGQAQRQARDSERTIGREGERALTDADRQFMESPFYNQRVDDVVGRDVVNEAGETLGDVDRVVSDGQEVYAVIGVGGFLGVGERDVIVPMRDLHVREDELVLPGATSESLEGMAEFDAASDNYLEVPSDHLIGDVYEGRGAQDQQARAQQQPRDSERMQEQDRQARDSERTIGREGERALTDADRQFMESPFYNQRVDDVVGRDVVNEAGETLGDVDRVVFDGQEVYAVIGVGGFLGIGERDVIVPMRDLHVQENELVLPGATRESLEGMAEFDAASGNYLEVPSNRQIGDVYEGRAS